METGNSSTLQSFVADAEQCCGVIDYVVRANRQPVLYENPRGLNLEHVLHTTSFALRYC